MDKSVYIVVFIGCIFLSRIILNKAYQKLSSEDKLRLTERFSKNTTFIYIGVFLSFVIFFLLLEFNVFNQQLIFNGYISGLLIYSVIKYVQSAKKLKEDNFPITYLNAYLQSRIISFIGFLVILFSINYN